MWLVRTNLKRWKTKQILSIKMSDNAKIVLTCKLCIVEMKHLFNSSWWNTSTSALPYLVIKGHKVRSASSEYFIFLTFFSDPVRSLSCLDSQSVDVCTRFVTLAIWQSFGWWFQLCSMVYQKSAGSQGVFCGFQIISN